MGKGTAFLLLTALACIALIPVAASADQGPPAAGGALEGRIICFDLSTLEEVDAAAFGSDDVWCVNTADIHRTTPKSGGLLDRLRPGPDPDAAALEEFRGELFELMDKIEALVAYLPPDYPKLDIIRVTLATERQRLAAIPPEELAIVRASFRDVGALQAQVEAAQAAFTTANVKVDADQPAAAPESFTIVPTPTPVTNPPPGIEHDSTAHDYWNTITGDLFPPGWPTDVGCPEQGYPYEVTFAMMIGIQAARAAELIAQVWCAEKTVTCPGVNVQDPPQCWAYVIIHTILNILEDTNDGFAFCDGGALSAYIQATMENLEIQHADNTQFDYALTTRFNELDNELFNFRNLGLRLQIEANLASAEDDPHALETLPRTVCISPELETLQQQAPFDPAVIAGCGRIEYVQDVVRFAMDATVAANGPGSIGNAEAEYAAAITHYNAGEWPQAYDRFRKAYRETGKIVNP